MYGIKAFPILIQKIVPKPDLRPGCVKVHVTLRVTSPVMYAGAPQPLSKAKTVFPFLVLTSQNYKSIAAYKLACEKIGRLHA